MRMRRIFNPFLTGPHLLLVVKQSTCITLRWMEWTTLFFCFVEILARQASGCAFFPLFPSHTEALYRPYNSTLLPHFPLTPLMKIASLGIMEGGLREAALGASPTPSCRSPLASGAQQYVASYPHSEVFVPFAAEGSSRNILSGKSTHSPEPPLEYWTKFDASALDQYTHTRAIEFSLASGVVWSQPNVPVTEDHGACSFSASPKAE